MSKPLVTIYSDGGCRPNPGIGGWGAVLIFENDEQELSGGEKNTTNNRMELTATCEALESLEQDYTVEFHTDSQYVKNGITSWMANWVRNDWLTSTKQPVQNQDLWERLYDATQRHTIRWKWVKGHAGHEYNERVDQLATAQIEELSGRTFVKKPPKVKPDSKADVKVYIRTTYSFDEKIGGWGAVVVSENGEQELSAIERNTSENQLVLSASIQALESLKSATSVAVYTDSEYLQKGMSQWIKGWMSKGWKTASGQPVKNRELWERLLQAAQRHQVQWIFSSDRSDNFAKRANELAKKGLK